MCSKIYLGHKIKDEGLDWSCMPIQAFKINTSTLKGQTSTDKVSLLKLTIEKHFLGKEGG